MSEDDGSNTLPLGLLSNRPPNDHRRLLSPDGRDSSRESSISVSSQQMRQSSLSKPPPDGQPRTPRTPNRVRFDLRRASTDSGVSPMTPSEQRKKLNDEEESPGWLEADDYFASSSNGTLGLGLTGADAPLLPNGHGPLQRMSVDEDFIPEDYLEGARPRSNMRAAFMNMANSIIGAGIIGQPYAIKQAGLLTGILLLVGLTFVVDWTIRLIVINSKLSGAASFQSTVKFCFGKPGLIAISLAQWAFAFGGMIAFCVIIGDTIPHVLEAVFPTLKDMPFLWLLTDRRAVICLFVLGISWPLSLYRDIAKLSKASTLALFSMVIIIITVITQGVRVPPELKGPIRGSFFINPGFFQAVGVISFAFVCHHNTLLIYTSLRTPTLTRFDLVVHLSTFISLIFCLVMALSGFLTFGSLTKGNLLNNFPKTNILVNIARFCFGLNMLTTLPLECFVCREVIYNYFWPRTKDHKHHDARRHFFITSGLVVAAVAVSLLTEDLGIVFELVGSTSACALAYILPPACYIKLISGGGGSGLPYSHNHQSVSRKAATASDIDDHDDGADDAELPLTSTTANEDDDSNSNKSNNMKGKTTTTGGERSGGGSSSSSSSTNSTNFTGKAKWKKLLPAYATIVFGVAVMVVSVVMSIMKIINGDGGGPGNADGGGDGGVATPPAPPTAAPTVR